MLLSSRLRRKAGMNITGMKAMQCFASYLLVVVDTRAQWRNESEVVGETSAWRWKM